MLFWEKENMRAMNIEQTPSFNRYIDEPFPKKNRNFAMGNSVSICDSPDENTYSMPWISVKINSFSFSFFLLFVRVMLFLFRQVRPTDRLDECSCKFIHRTCRKKCSSHLYAPYCFTYMVRDIFYTSVKFILLSFTYFFFALVRSFSRIFHFLFVATVHWNATHNSKKSENK